MTNLALSAWPLVTLALVMSLPFPKAALISILGGFLLLPSFGGMDLPLLPPFNKDSIPALSVLVLAVLLYRTKDTNDRYSLPALPGWLPRAPIGIVCLAMLVLGVQMTALTNGERIVYGPTVLPGLRIYDGFSIALAGLTMAVPLFIGRKFFAHPENQALLLRGLVIAGLGYSLLALYEIRMSPQLSRIVYGEFANDWRQMIRGGGWRPAVFMHHGLQLAIFMAAVTLAAFGASRCLEQRRRSLYFFAGAWLFGTLLLSNSLGALIIAAMFLPAVLFLPTRLQLLFAGVMAGIVLLYPLLRSVDVIPTDRFIALVEGVDEQRASSLQYRVINEDILLAHAREKPFFGWGTWNRNRVFDETGDDVSTTDGAWILSMGKTGWIGYLAEFGLLTLPIILLAIRSWRREEVPQVTSVLALVLVAQLIDLIPNSFLSPVTVLMAGALWGRLELDAKAASIAPKEIADPSRDQGRTRTGPAAARDGPLTDDAAGVSAYTRQKVRRTRARHAR